MVEFGLLLLYAALVNDEYSNEHSDYCYWQEYGPKLLIRTRNCWLDVAFSIEEPISGIALWESWENMCLKKDSSSNFKLWRELSIAVNSLFEVNFNGILFQSTDDIRISNVFSKSYDVGKVLPISEVEGHYHGLCVDYFHVGLSVNACVIYSSYWLWSCRCNVLVIIAKAFWMTILENNATRVNWSAIKFKFNIGFFLKVKKVAWIKTLNGVNIKVRIFIFSLTPFVKCRFRNVYVTHVVLWNLAVCSREPRWTITSSILHTILNLAWDSLFKVWQRCQVQVSVVCDSVFSWIVRLEFASVISLSDWYHDAIISALQVLVVGIRIVLFYGVKLHVRHDIRIHIFRVAWIGRWRIGLLQISSECRIGTNNKWKRLIKVSKMSWLSHKLLVMIVTLQFTVSLKKFVANFLVQNYGTTLSNFIQLLIFLMHLSQPFHSFWCSFSWESLEFQSLLLFVFFCWGNKVSKVRYFGPEVLHINFSIFVAKKDCVLLKRLQKTFFNEFVRLHLLSVISHWIEVCLDISKINHCQEGNKY